MLMQLAGDICKKELRIISAGELLCKGESDCVLNTTAWIQRIDSMLVEAYASNGGCDFTYFSNTWFFCTRHVFVIKVTFLFRCRCNHSTWYCISVLAHFEAGADRKRACSKLTSIIHFVCLLNARTLYCTLSGNVNPQSCRFGSSEQSNTNPRIVALVKHVAFWLIPFCHTAWM